jgi:ketosteroid isomerase-like protein
MTNTEQIRKRVRDWEKAVQEKNWDGIMAWHHQDIVMFDVPPPFQSIGLEAYRATYVDFLRSLQNTPDAFKIVDLHITAGEDVAFCFSPMKCTYYDKPENKVKDLDYRLTIGLKKIDGEWWFMHEHHSVPAE